MRVRDRNGTLLEYTHLIVAGEEWDDSAERHERDVANGKLLCRVVFERQMLRLDFSVRSCITTFHGSHCSAHGPTTSPAQTRACAMRDESNLELPEA